MTANKNTPMPGVVTKRKNGKVIALCLVGALVVGGGGYAGTLASQMDAMQQDANYGLSRLVIDGNREPLNFDLNEGVDTTAQLVTITHAGGAGVKAHAGFAPERFDPLVPAALTDTKVRVWEASIAGVDKPWLNDSTQYWEGTLGEYLNTSFVSNKVLASGETTEFYVDIATPYGVDPTTWLMPSGTNAESVNTASVVKLVVGINPQNDESSLSTGSTFDGAYGFRTGVAQELLDAAAPIVGTTAPMISWEDDTDTLASENQGIRTFYSDPERTQVIGTILLDLTKNEGEDGYVIDGDYDGDGNSLTLFGMPDA